MKRFKNILVLAGPDGGRDDALDTAIWLAKANSAKLTVLDVLEQPSGFFSKLFASVDDSDGAAIDVSALDDAVAQARNARLEKAASAAREAGVDAVAVCTRGALFVAAIRRVLSEGHDLVVKAARDDGDIFFEPQDMSLMRKCPCPVWIVKDGASGPAQKILAALDPADDGDETRDRLAVMIMELATSLAERRDAEIHALTAWTLPEEPLLRSARVNAPPAEIDGLLAKAEALSRERLDELLAKTPSGGDRLTVRHVKGAAGNIVPEVAADIGADVIVMGTVGRAGVGGFLIGNTAETILNRVRCSVLALKPEGFVSPVTLADGEDGLG